MRRFSTAIDTAIGNAALYAMLLIEKQKILLPQNEIGSLESASSVIKDIRIHKTVGCIEFEGREWPVYSFAEDLSLLEEMPTSRRICVLVNRITGYFGIVCDQFGSLRKEDLKLHPMPTCMMKKTTPLSALAIEKNGVGLVTTAARLATFLELKDGGQTDNG